MALGRRRFLWNLPLMAFVNRLWVTAAPAGKQDAAVWTFDRLDHIGGFPAIVLGHPRVIRTPLGKAVEFNGVDDAIFIDNHPLAGAETFTFEVFFRPDRGGAAEQRWFHLSTLDPKTGQDTDTRIMFEIRVIGEQWCLEALVNTPKGYQPLIDRSLLHPLGAWHHVAMVYDGKELRRYVNGVLEQKGLLEFSPEGPGHSSVGARINRVYYFKGAVRQARFTRTALAPAGFLKL
jgi:hypothetical protein